MKLTKLLIVVFTVCVGFLVQAQAEDIDALLEKASKDPELERTCSPSTGIELDDCHDQGIHLYHAYYKSLKEAGKIPAKIESLFNQVDKKLENTYDKSVDLMVKKNRIKRKRNRLRNKLRRIREKNPQYNNPNINADINKFEKAMLELEPPIIAINKEIDNMWQQGIKHMQDAIKTLIKNKRKLKQTSKKQNWDETTTWATLENGCPKAQSDMPFERIQLIHECLVELGTLLKTRFNNLKDIGKITPAMEFARQPEEQEFIEQNSYYANRYNEINESDNREPLNALYAEWCNYIRSHYKGSLRFIRNAADREVETPSSTTDNQTQDNKTMDNNPIDTMSTPDTMGDKKQINGFQKTKDEQGETKANKEDKRDEKKPTNNEGADEYYDSSKEFKGYN